jgi:hypothetical protein
MGSSGVAERTDRVTVAAAIIAAGLGLASVGVSAYWPSEGSAFSTRSEATSSAGDESVSPRLS